MGVATRGGRSGRAENGAAVRRMGCGTEDFGDVAARAVRTARGGSGDLPTGVSEGEACRMRMRRLRAGLLDRGMQAATPATARCYAAFRLRLRDDSRGMRSAAERSAGFGARLSQPSVMFGMAFDRPRLRAVGPIADLMPGDDAELCFGQSGEHVRLG
jgi:hypothetical protein